jgi:hypothetical protein
MGRSGLLAVAVDGKTVRGGDGRMRLVLLVFPVMVAVSGTAIHLHPNLPWLLIGVVAFHGLAQELVSRGYAFRGGARRDDTFKLVVIPTAALPT